MVVDDLARMLIHGVNIPIGDHALFCASRVIVMERGSVIADGPPSTVLDQACLHRIYSTDVRVLDVDVDGKPTRVCVPVMD